MHDAVVGISVLLHVAVVGIPVPISFHFILSISANHCSRCSRCVPIVILIVSLVSLSLVYVADDNDTSNDVDVDDTGTVDVALYDVDVDDK
jgi:hypothetical protein